MTAKRVNLLATTTNKPPVLQRSQKGDPYTTFTVVTSDRTKDRTGQWIDGPTQFYRCTAFGTTAENIVNTCAQPTELVISGKETTEEWASDQGPRLSVKSPSTRWGFPSVANMQTCIKRTAMTVHRNRQHNQLTILGTAPPHRQVATITHPSNPMHSKNPRSFTTGGFFLTTERKLPMNIITPKYCRATRITCQLTQSGIDRRS